MLEYDNFQYSKSRRVRIALSIIIDKQTHCAPGQLNFCNECNDLNLQTTRRSKCTFRTASSQGIKHLNSFHFNAEIYIFHIFHLMAIFYTKYSTLFLSFELFYACVVGCLPFDIFLWSLETLSATL